MMEPRNVLHPILPLYDGRSRILILGSFPSVASRTVAFFYGHPQNRFWRVIAAVCGAPVPQTVAEKTAFLHQNGIALWDVIAACRIKGSADSSITDVRPNDLRPLLAAAPIKRIFVNGKTAQKYYDRYILPELGIPALCLPSTSPANATYSLARLIEAWRVILDKDI